MARESIHDRWNDPGFGTPAPSLDDLANVPVAEWVNYMLDHKLADTRGQASLIASVLLTGEGDIVQTGPEAIPGLRAEGGDEVLADFDPDQPRDPQGKWRRIGVPAAPSQMFVTPARSERADAEAYYRSPRYRQFRADVRRQAKDLGVTIDGEAQTQGIWSDTPEPSATYTLHDGEAIDRLAARIGRHWNQDAVLNFTPDDDGPDAEWHFQDAGRANDSKAILKAAEDNGLFGATRNGSDIVVIAGPDMGGEDEAALRQFGEQLGASEAFRFPGRARLIESSEYDDLDPNEGDSQDSQAASGVREDDHDADQVAAEAQAQELLAEFDPAQPRDQQGRWRKVGFGLRGKEAIFLDPYHTSPATRASPRFKPLPKPTSKEQAREKEPGGKAPVVLAPQIESEITRLGPMEEQRFPEGTLVQRNKAENSYRIDGPDGTFWRVPPDAAAKLTEFEETTARANRFGESIPGNPMVPLGGVDQPSDDPIGDVIGGVLHGGYAPLPRGTLLHRRVGEGGDFFDVKSPTGVMRSIPATDKEQIKATAIEFEKQAEGKLGGDVGDSGYPFTESVADPTGQLQPLPRNFVETRKAMHAESERVLGYEAEGNEVALFRTPGGFGTPEYTDTDGKATQWAVEGKDVVLRKDGKEVARDEVSPLADEQSARQLGDFFDFADRNLRAVAESADKPGDDGPESEWERFGAPIIWPEHFDMGIELGTGDEANPNTRAGFGLSPGDEAHPEPYAYVNPWSPKERSEFWNGDTFNGAYLSYREILASGDQDKAVQDFFREHLKALGAEKK